MEATLAQVRALRDAATAQDATACPLLLGPVPQGGSGGKGAGGARAAAADRDRGADRRGGIRAAELCLLWGGDAGGAAG